MRLSSFLAAATRAIITPRRLAMRMNAGAIGGAAVVAGDRFDRCPPHQRRALFGDVAAVDLGVGLAVAGGEARPRAQVPSVREPTDIADLGDHDRGGDATHAVKGLDRAVTLVVSQASVQLAFDHGPLALVALEQAAQ